MTDRGSEVILLPPLELLEDELEEELLADELEELPEDRLEEEVPEERLEEELPDDRPEEALVDPREPIESPVSSKSNSSSGGVLRVDATAGSEAGSDAVREDDPEDELEVVERACSDPEGAASVSVASSASPASAAASPSSGVPSAAPS